MVRISAQAEHAAAAIVDGNAAEGVTKGTTEHRSDEAIPIDPVSSESAPIGTPPPEAQHDISWDGDDAFCRRHTDGLVDCQACLLTAKAALVRATTSENAELMNNILDESHIAAEEGLEKTRIMVNHSGISFWKHTLTGIALANH